MTESRGPSAQVGLCATCAHARNVPAPRATYWRCALAATDPRFVKYPRLPVIECDGYTPGEPVGGKTGEASE